MTATEAPPEPIRTDLRTLENSPPTDLETAVETPNEMLRNVVPFRPMSEPKAPALTPVENNAFNELARQLSARLESENITFAPPVESSTTDVSVEPPAAAEIPKKTHATTKETFHETNHGTIQETIQETTHEQPSWLTRPEPPARGETRRDKSAARSDAGRRPDLPARPAALCQSGVSDTYGLCEPACAGAGRRSRRALCRTRRVLGQQHVGHRHAGDDQRKPNF